MASFHGQKSAFVGSSRRKIREVEVLAEPETMNSSIV
jgi:hypothetical protein